MPPGGKFESIYWNFSAVLELIVIKLDGIGCSMTMHDVAKFQGDLTLQREIHNFMEILIMQQISLSVSG